MESIQFLTKVWVKRKWRWLNGIVGTCAFIYFIFDVLMMIMEGIHFWALAYGILAFAVFIDIFSSRKNKGKFVQTKCQITFTPGMMEWKYPSLDFEDGQGRVSIKYTINCEDVLNATLDPTSGLVQIKCKPLVEKQYLSRGNEDVESTDYRKKKQTYNLVLHQCDIYHFQSLYEKYMGSEMEVLDE